MRKILFPFALASLLFASCSNDENETGTDNGRIPATFSADISLTRASLSTWDADDAIGIYMLDAGTTNISEAAANRKYLTPAADGEFSPAAAGQTIYFPVDGTRKVDFVAYYPYTAGLTDNIYKADISTQNTPASIDLMTARIASTADKPLDKDHTDVTFTFAHRLSRVEVNVKAGDGFADADLAGLVITLSSQPLKADFELLTDKLTPGSETGTIALNTSANGQNASAIILPQEERTGRTLTFTMTDNSIFTWDIEADRTFETGKKTVFNIRLARAGIEVTTSIQAWGIQGVVDGDIIIGGDTPAGGNINMNGKTAEEVKAAIKATFDAGITEFTLTGPIANLGLSGEDYSVNPFYNTAVTKLDLSGVTDWEPVNIDGYVNSTKTVIGVPETAFLSCTALETVVLPEEVKAIGHNAFNYCLSLSKINLENVTHIGYWAFKDCSALKEVDMSEVTTIYKGAFWRAGLIALSLPKATSISEGITDGNSGDAGSFSSCQSLASVEALSLTNTGYRSFSGCTALKTVNMPELTDIKQEAFFNTGLESINLGKVTTVDKEAFERCEKLTKVELPSLATVGGQAFKGCIELVEIELTATTIGDFLFPGCTKLKTLSLPNATTFGYNIVADCSALTNLKLTAAGALVSIDGDAIWEETFGSASLSDFKYSDCALVLNTDKRQDGAGSPTVTDATTWLKQTWKSIAFE